MLLSREQTRKCSATVRCDRMNRKLSHALVHSSFADVVKQTKDVVHISHISDLGESEDETGEQDLFFSEITNVKQVPSSFRVWSGIPYIM